MRAPGKRIRLDQPGESYWQRWSFEQCIPGRQLVSSEQMLSNSPGVAEHIPSTQKGAFPSKLVVLPSAAGL